jgi:hypothetical protein
VGNDLLAYCIDKPLARYLIIAHKGIENILAYLLPVVLTSRILINLGDRLVLLLASKRESHKGFGHALATLLLEVRIEVMIECDKSACTLDGKEKTSML